MTAAGGPEDSVLNLDPRRLGRTALLAVRLAFGIAGGAAVVLGALMLLAPSRTLHFTAVVLGLYFCLAGVLRLALGIFGRMHGQHHRTLGVTFGALLLIAGIIILRDAAAAAATLLLIMVLFAGIGWIIDGVLSIVESGRGPARAWAITYGAICLVSGIVMLAVPGWSILWLTIYSAVALLVLGIAGIVRAFMFGRGAIST